MTTALHPLHPGEYLDEILAAAWYQSVWLGQGYRRATNTHRRHSTLPEVHHGVHGL